jgi:hypothetical protein
MQDPRAPGGGTANNIGFLALTAVGPWAAHMDPGQAALVPVAGGLIAAAAVLAVVDPIARVTPRLTRSERLWSIVALIAAVWLSASIVATAGSGNKEHYADCYSYDASSYSMC